MKIYCPNCQKQQPMTSPSRRRRYCKYCGYEINNNRGDKMDIIKMRNRASVGTRVCSEDELKRGEICLDFCIGYHHVRQEYYVEVYTTKIKETEFGPYRDCSGGMKYFSDSPEDCIRWIEETYNCKIKLLNNLILGCPDRQVKK